MGSADRAAVVTARAGEVVLVGAVVAALAVALTWPLAAHLGSGLPSDLGDPLLNAFTLAWGADRLPHGLRGFWDAPFYFPSPHALARSEHLLGITIFTAPVQWATGNAVLAYNLAFLGSYVLAGIGMYLLARSLWEVRAAGWVAAIAFAFAPHRVAHVSHLQMLVSGWTPLALYGLHRFARTGSRRALAVFGASVWLQALSCGYLMYFVLLPVGIVALAELWRLRGDRRAGRDAGSAPRPAFVIAGLALATLVVLVLLSPVAREYLAMRGSVGFRRTIGDMLLFSAAPSDYWHIPRLAAWGGWLPPGRAERELFPGLTVTALATVAILLAAGAVLRRKGKNAGQPAWAIGLYTAVLAAATWLSLGPAVPGPYRALVAWLPGFDGLRVPARFVVIVSLALAVLAGAAVARAASRLRPRTAGWLAGGICLLILVEGYPGPMPVAAFDVEQRARRDLNGWLRAGPPGGLLELPISGPGLEPFTLEYQFNTLLHGHPIVNGYSGSGYALQDFLAGAGSPLEDEREVAPALQALRELGVRYVVLHQRLYTSRAGDEATRNLVAALDDADDQLASRARFADTVAWRLTDRPPGATDGAEAGSVVPRAVLRVSASSAVESAGLVLDGSTETRWSSGRGQSGGEWLRFDLAREMDVAQIVLRSPRRGHTDRPRSLVVESEDPSGASRLLRESSILPEMMRSIARGGPMAPVVIDLPTNRSRSITLRQAGQTPYWYWSVYELELRTRPALARNR